MLLFIFETIGTQELILIGIIALIFLGPRKIPEYARKLGKLMADLKSTTNDFKATWEREVNFAEEAKALRLDLAEKEAEEEIARERTIKKPATPTTGKSPELLPAVREIPAEEFTGEKASASEPKSEVEENIGRQNDGATHPTPEAFNEKPGKDATEDSTAATGISKDANLGAEQQKQKDEIEAENLLDKRSWL